MAKVFESSLEGAMKAIAVSAQLTEQGYPVPIMLLGNPGAAKSAFVRIFSELMGFEFLNIEAASRQPEDFFGYMTTPDKVEGKMVEPSLIVSLAGLDVLAVTGTSPPDWYVQGVVPGVTPAVV